MDDRILDKLGFTAQCCLFIFKSLLDEFDKDASIMITQQTNKTVTYQVTPIGRDPYTQIFLHLDVQSVIRWSKTNVEAYERFCDIVGSTLERAFCEKKESRLKPKTTFVMVSL